MLRVARSAYYAWARREPTARVRADQVLTEQIASARARSRRTYGAPRIHAALRAQGTRCARKRVARLLRAAGLVGGHCRRRARTTVADPAPAPAPNLVARDFATLKTELVGARSWPTQAAARTAIFEWIEVFYNRQRYHSALAYQSPATFADEMLVLSTKAA